MCSTKLTFPQIPLPERHFLARVLAQSGKAVIDFGDRDGTDGSHSFDPGPAHQRVGTGDLVPAPGQMLGQRPANVTVYPGNEHSHS